MKSCYGFPREELPQISLVFQKDYKGPLQAKAFCDSMTKKWYNALLSSQQLFVFPKDTAQP